MFERLEEPDLLALIEDQLDARAAAALRARLSNEPQVVAAIEQMRHQRGMLRSLAEPLVPADLMAPLEPLLARPMLIQTPGTDWRRKQRLMRRLRMTAAAAAACIMIGGGVAAWYWVQSMSDPVELNPILASGKNTEGAGSPGRLVTAGIEAAQTWPENAVFHHRFPDGDEGVMLAVRNGGGTATMGAAVKEPLTARTDSRPVAAGFALVLMVDPESATTVLREVATGFNNRGALVRNISPEHYAAYKATMSADAAPGGPGAERNRVPGLSPDVAAAINLRPLAGSLDFGPSIDQQAEFAGHGATMTLSIPIADLSAALTKLSGLNSRLILLNSLPDGESPSRGISEPGPTAWLEQAGRIQQMVEQLRAAGGQGDVVLLPVVIQPPRRGF